MNEKYLRPDGKAEPITALATDVRLANEQLEADGGSKLRQLGEAACAMAAAEALTIPPLSQRVNRILKIAGKPLTNLEIINRLNDSGYGPANPNSVRSRLSFESRNGRIKHLARGLHASLDFDEASYELSPQLTIVERIAHILEIADEPLTNEEIACRLNDDGYGQVCRESVGSQLSVARDRRMIQRVGHGFYASPAFDERISGLPIKRTTLPSIIVRVIDAADQPLNAEAITIAAIRERGREYKKDSVVHALSGVCRQEHVKRVAPGYYASVNFEGSFQPPRTDTIEERFLKLLADGGRMEFSEILAGLKGDGLPAVTDGSLMNQLGISCRKGRVKRLDKGVYAGVDFKGPDSPPEKLKARTLAILKAAGRPMTRAEILAGLNREEEAFVELSRVKNILERACKRGEIEHLRRGVYASVPETGGPTGPLSLKQRIHRLLEAAGRPMAFAEIVSELGREDSGELNLASLRSRLSVGCREGVFIRLKKGLYTSACAEYSASEHQGTLTGQVLGILLTAGRPMACAEVADSLQAAGWEETNRASVRSILHQSFRKGLIERPARNAYVSSSREQPPRRQTGSQSMLWAIEAADKPMSARDVLVAIGLPTTSENAKKANSLLAHICAKGKIQRLERGFYAGVNFKGQYDVEAIQALSVRILKTLESSGRPMSLKEVAAALAKGNSTPANLSSVKAYLSGACSKGQIKRLRRGVYASPNLSLENFVCSVQPTLEERTVRIINAADQPLSNSAIFAALANDGFKAHALNTTNSAIAKAYSKGQIKRLRRGLYAASDYSGPLPAVVDRQREKKVSAAVRSQKPAPKAKSENSPKRAANPQNPPKKQKRKSKTRSQTQPPTIARPKRQKKAEAPPRPLGAGRRIPQIVDRFGGDITVDEVFTELAKLGFKDLNHQHFEPLIASVIRRKRRFLQL